MSARLSAGHTPYPPGYGFPFAFRQAAFASWVFVSRWRIPPFLRRAYRQSRTPTGFPRSALGRCDRGGCHLYSGAIWCPHGTAVGPASMQIKPLCIRWPNIVALAIFHVATTKGNEASTMVHLRSSVRSSLSPAPPYGSGRPWTFPLAMQRLVTYPPHWGRDSYGHSTG